MTINGLKVGVADSTSMKASDTYFTSLRKMSDRSEMLTAESHREKFISQFMFGMREFTSSIYTSLPDIVSPFYSQAFASVYIGIIDSGVKTWKIRDFFEKRKSSEEREQVVRVVKRNDKQKLESRKSFDVRCREELRKLKF